jgi:hypothetical protein
MIMLPVQHMLDEVEAQNAAQRGHEHHARTCTGVKGIGQQMQEGIAQQHPHRHSNQPGHPASQRAVLYVEDEE